MRVSRPWLTAVLLAISACTPNAGNTSMPTITVEPVVTTRPDAPPGVDLDLFRQGLIRPEQSAVNDLIGRAPFYELNLALGQDLTSITGTEEVRYTNQEDVSLDEVVFRLFPNIADGQSIVTNLTVDGVPVIPAVELEDSVMRVPLEAALPPGQRVTIKMDLAVIVPTEEGGNYGTFRMGDDILAAATFYPVLAVYDDEGWNVEIPSPSGDVVYSDVGFYMVTITAPDDLPIVTSGQLVAKEAPGPDGVGQRTFVAGPVRDFYLAASRRFNMVQAKVGDTTINSYSPPEFVAQNRDVLRLAETSLELFNDLYGPYPYVELDIVSTATRALGVEYPGVIALNMGHFDPAAGFDRPTVVSTVVHEVAHQWFYGTVGNDQLDEPWLDESLAQYATWTYWRITQGPGADEGFLHHLESLWQRVEYADIPIGMPVASYEGREYSAIVYGRGPLFVYELAAVMGQENFDVFLSDYARAFKYGIATTEDFERLAEADCGCDLSGRFAEAVYPR